MNIQFKIYPIPNVRDSVLRTMWPAKPYISLRYVDCIINVMNARITICNGTLNLPRHIYLQEKCVSRIHDYQPSMHILLLFSNYYMIYTLPTSGWLKVSLMHTHLNILLSLKTYMVFRDEVSCGRVVVWRGLEMGALSRG